MSNQSSLEEIWVTIHFFGDALLGSVFLVFLVTLLLFTLVILKIDKEKENRFLISIKMILGFLWGFGPIVVLFSVFIEDQHGGWLLMLLPISMCAAGTFAIIMDMMLLRKSERKKPIFIAMLAPLLVYLIGMVYIITRI